MRLQGGSETSLIMRLIGETARCLGMGRPITDRDLVVEAKRQQRELRKWLRGRIEQRSNNGESS